MNLIGRLGRMVEECRAEYEGKRREEPLEFVCREVFGGQGEDLEKENLMFCGDNEKVMEWLLGEKGLAGSLRLIYIDPPFFSGSDYAAGIRPGVPWTESSAFKQKAYGDTWENGMEEYLRMLTRRLFPMRELLSETGGIWVHLDWHAVHYVKIIMDEIFGEKNFVNEVIWNYKSGGVSNRRFARKHDTLLYYGKTEKYFFRPQKEKSYNRGYRPYRFKGVEEFEDERGWYTLVNRKDVWQIDMVGRTSAERTGYATQKPERLIQQILESCTEEGDLCADFFCGSGTLPSAAWKMNRRWICCDSGALAVASTRKRMMQAGAPFRVFYPKNEERPEFAGKEAQTGEIPAAEGGASIRAEAVFENLRVSVILRDYQTPALSHAPLGKGQREKLKTIASSDPTSLVDCWAVDFRYDGGVFRPQFTACRKGNELALEARAEGHGYRGENAIAVKVWDVLGGSGFLTLNRSIWEDELEKKRKVDERENP